MTASRTHQAAVPAFAGMKPHYVFTHHGAVLKDASSLTIKNWVMQRITTKVGAVPLQTAISECEFVLRFLDHEALRASAYTWLKEIHDLQADELQEAWVIVANGWRSANSFEYRKAQMAQLAIKYDALLGRTKQEHPDWYEVPFYPQGELPEFLHSTKRRGRPSMTKAAARKQASAAQGGAAA